MRCVCGKRSSRQCYQHSKDVYVIGYVCSALGKKKKFKNYAKQLYELGYAVIDKNACRIFQNCWQLRGDWSSFLQTEMTDNTSTKRYNAIFSMKSKKLDKRRRWWDIVESPGGQSKSQTPIWCFSNIQSKRNRINTILDPFVDFKAIIVISHGYSILITQ